MQEGIYAIASPSILKNLLGVQSVASSATWEHKALIVRPSMNPANVSLDRRVPGFVLSLLKLLLLMLRHACTENY